MVEELNIDEYPLLQAGDVFYLPVRAFTGEVASVGMFSMTPTPGCISARSRGVSATAFFDTGSQLQQRVGRLYSFEK